MAKKCDNSIKIVLLDNLTLFRAGLKLLIENEADMELVGEAGNFDDALMIISKKKPDIILLEINETGDLDLEAIPRLIRLDGHGCLILITRSEDAEIYIQAVRNGALGVVSKAQPPEILLKAIRKVHAGEVWLDRSMMATILTNITQDIPSQPTNMDNEIISQLSSRERDIIFYIAQGLNTKEIASKLYVSPTTIRHNLTSIYEKVGVSGRLELLIFAYRAGLNNSLITSN